MLNYNEIEKLIASENFSVAKAKILRLLQFFNQDSTLYNLLGITQYYLNDENEAIESLRKAVSINPANINAALNLVDLLLSNGNYKDAALILTDSLAYNPTNGEIKDVLNKISSNPEAANIVNEFNSFQSYFPTTFVVETALACNLKCPECAIGDGSVNRKKGYLSFEKFKILADKVRPFVKYFYLHLWGEPMLNKEIIKMVKYASDFSDVNISTNATILDEKLSEELILSGVRDIIVSIDGITQEIYEKYRVGGDLEKALNGLKYLVKFRAQHSANVNIMPQFIVFKHNQHEMDEYAKYMQNLGLKAFFKAPYFRHDDSAFELSDYKEYRRPEFDTIEDLKKGMADCTTPRDVFTVQVNGDVILCCHDYNKQTFYGNLFEKDVEEIWNSPEYRLDRWKIISGRAIDFCVNNCMTYIPSPKLKKELSQNKFKKLETVSRKKTTKVNLCSGPILLDNWINVDISPIADITIDLEKELLPFENNSVDELVCISAINYFTLERGFEIIKDVYRVLKDDGITRFAVQDLKTLAKRYLERDEKFFFEKLPDGRDRFPGITFADKFSQWFYGFESGGKSCKYVYDYETLSLLFEKAGFEIVEEKKYLESEIEEIEKIDNRPEQMFYLEARKKKTASTKTDEKTWQRILQDLDENPENETLVKKAGEIIEKEKRFEDAVKLYGNFLRKKENSEILKKYQTALNSLKKEREKKPQINEEQLSLLNRLQAPKDDDFHLQKAMAWLLRAFEVKNKKGVSAAYNLRDEKWMVSYPETTGYIISTFFEYSKISDEKSYYYDAVKMANWEINLQWENGGIGEPIGVYGLRPRIFNTAQVMLGLLNAYRQTHNDKYLESAIKAGDWIITSQDENGKWTKNTYQGARTYHSRVAWAMGELFTLTGNEKYQDSITKFLSWVITKARNNGWFEETSLSDPQRPWTHLYGYTIFGLLKLCELNLCGKHKEKIETLLTTSAENILKLINSDNKPYLGLPGVFDENFSPNYNWSCLTGNSQIEIFLRRFGKLTDNNHYIKTADKLLEDMKQTQYLQIDDKNIYGGIGGSYPIYGEYSPLTIPNWAVKFFADSFIQKILLEKNSFENYLG